MLLLNLLALDKNNENLIESFRSHWRPDHFDEAPDGFRNLLVGTRIGRRSTGGGAHGADRVCIIYRYTLALA